MIQRFFGTLVRHLDAPLLGLLTLLLLASTAVVFSAAGENSERLYSHLTNIGVALTAMLLVSHIPPQRLMQFAVPVYVVGVLLLLGVAMFGIVVNGSRPNMRGGTSIWHYSSKHWVSIRPPSPTTSKRCIWGASNSCPPAALQLSLRGLRQLRAPTATWLQRAANT